MNLQIIDYGSGNLQSVANAFNHIGLEAGIARDAADVKKADLLVLPGVGSFDNAIASLEKQDVLDQIKKHIKSGKQYLGMCLGLQVLYESSQEGSKKGLGILKGTVKKFIPKNKCKIPHMGWNSIRLKRDIPGLKDGMYYYFVHSYYACPDNDSEVAASTDYAGISFASVVNKDNITAMQFHPERSQDAGLTFIREYMKKI